MSIFLMMTVFFHDDHPLPPIGQIAETEIQQDLSDSAYFLYHQLDADGKRIAYDYIYDVDEKDPVAKSEAVKRAALARATEKLRRK